MLTVVIQHIKESSHSSETKCTPYREEADLLARALGCRLLRTSVKEDINVNAVFRHLAACCLAELHFQEEEYALSGGSNGIHPLTISKYSTTNKQKKTMNCFKVDYTTPIIHSC